MKLNSTEIQTVYGNFELFCFNWGEHEDDNVLCLRVSKVNSERTNVRIQSACFTAEIFRSKDCDCHEQLVESLSVIQSEGGMLIYLLQDGRGAGIFRKVEGLELGRTEGLDTAEAYERMGIAPDPRSYIRASAVLKYFGVDKVKLLTNNPRKLNGLSDAGFDVERRPIEIPPTTESLPYLATKMKKFGHLLSLNTNES